MSKVTVLVVGSGGREHAIAWALARSPRVEQIYVAPGNAGTEWSRPESAPAQNVAIHPDDVRALVTFARERQVALTIVGPETALAAGIVDAFQAAGLRIFGPTRAAARLESSKVFAKSFMQAHGIPTAAYAVFDKYEAARRFVLDWQRPVVVKADGLAGGKGVIVCGDEDEAVRALHRMMVAREFGDAGRRVVVEERLSGPELSVLAFSDGRTLVTLPPARDHKRLCDGDRGPNTGGMGAYAPVPDGGPARLDEIRRTILQPAIDGMAARGTPYTGVLYAGLMLTPLGPMVLEFNCRFGDPETQAILPLLATDLLAVLLACVEGRLDREPVHWRPGACVTLVLASQGYPGPCATGLPIFGLDTAPAEDLTIFHAGTARRDGRVVTAGGRVLAVSARGPDLGRAAAGAYVAAERIGFEGRHYRRDVGRAP